MWVVIAIVALIVVIVSLILLRKTRGKFGRRLSESRPTYCVGTQTVHAVTEWTIACEKSLAWSRKRRNKEIK